MRSPLVGIPGLEPGKAGPESAVLPLHHTPIFLPVFGMLFSVVFALKSFISELRCKGTHFF